MHDEDLLEQLFWDFDHESKHSGDIRMAFESVMRYYAKAIVDKQLESAAALLDETTYDWVYVDQPATFNKIDRLMKEQNEQ